MKKRHILPKVMKKNIAAYAYQHYDSATAKDLLDKTAFNYDGYMKSDVDAGGKTNVMMHFYTIAVSYFAFYEACGRVLDETAIDAIVYPALARPFFRLKRLHFNLNARWMQGTANGLIRLFAKFHNRQVKLHRARGEWKDTWTIRFDPARAAKGIPFDLVGCPIAKFAKEHGFAHLMPDMCKQDYKTIRLIGGKLIREHTVAEGYALCDYLYVGSEENS